MTTEQLKLRDIENAFTLEGEVENIDIALKEYPAKNSAPAYKALTGTVAVRTSKTEVYEAVIFHKEMTKEGKPNKLFANIQKFISEAVSNTDIAQEISDAPHATCVRLTYKNGKLSLNEFFAGEDLVSQVQIRATFLNTIPRTECKPAANFDIEGVIQKVVPEMKNGDEPTGRYFVTLLVPDAWSKTVSPIVFVTQAAHEAMVESNFTPNKTVRLMGRYINSYKETVEEIAVSFGEPETRVHTTRVTELEIKSGVIYEADNAEKTIPTELIKQFLVNRNQQLATKKEQAAAYAANQAAQNNTPAVDVSGGTAFGTGEDVAAGEEDNVADLGASLFG